MSPFSITNAQLQFALTLLSELQNPESKFENAYIKQVIYAQFKQIINDLINEIAKTYNLTVLTGDKSFIQSLNYLFEQAPNMAELKVIENLISNDSNSFIDKIINFELEQELKNTSESIFKTVNTESEIFSELKNLINILRDMSVQQ